MRQDERTALIAYFIREREEIKAKKNYGEPRPWTADQILDTYRFCNVRREDDRVTRWLAYHWRTPFYDHPNLTLAIALARLVNWPPTLEEIGFPRQWKPELVRRLLEARKARADRVWNGAYMITTCGAEVGKAGHVVEVLNRVYAGSAAPLYGDTLEMAHSRLTKILGLGSFLAAQIVADLKYTPFNHLLHASDWWTWAALGTGSERGLRWWLGRDRTLPSYEFLPRLTELAAAVTPLIPGIAPLHMQDWQSVCCEIDKYCRAKEGRGRPKQNYSTTEEAYVV